MSKENKAPVRLRTADEINDAYEYLFNKQRDGEIDSKQADALNTTLKGATYLRVKLRMDLLKIVVQAAQKKIIIPEHLLPDGLKLQQSA